jgi:hypothetical protein
MYWHLTVEHGGRRFFRNVGTFLPELTVSHSRRQYYSVKCIDRNKKFNWNKYMEINNIIINMYIDTVTNNSFGYGSEFGIATGNGLDDRRVGVRVAVKLIIFSSLCRPNRLWDPSSLVSKGHKWLLLRRVKRPGREAYHSLLTSTEVKKAWIYTSISPYVFMA